MKPHKVRKKAIEKQHFKQEKSPSGNSILSMFKDSMHYMNIFSVWPPTMYMCGNESLYIEHYEHIIEYNSCRVRLQLDNMQLLLEGKHLCLEYFSKHDIKIHGTIDRMSFFNTPSATQGRGRDRRFGGQ